MIAVFYSFIDSEWDDIRFQKNLIEIPAYMKKKILSYHRWQDRQLSIGGKLLLIKMIHFFELEKIASISEMIYNPYDRPFLNSSFDFNISHSGEIVICAGCINNTVGIDIEQIRDVVVGDFYSCFSENEVLDIEKSSEKLKAFYKTWTRKEALLKSIGTGFSSTLNNFDTTSDVIFHSNTSYFLQELEINDNYKLSIAMSKFDDDFFIKEYNEF